MLPSRHHLCTEVARFFYTISLMSSEERNTTAVKHRCQILNKYKIMLSNVKQTVEQVVQEHQKGDYPLDAMWIAITINSKNWRLAKKLGAVKDYYYGWILTSTSTNGGGTDLCEKLCKITALYPELQIRTYQL